MKHFKLLLFLTIFALLSCSKDDDNSGPSPDELIIGNWNVSELYLNDGVVTQMDPDTTIMGTFTAQGSNLDGTVSFAQDSTYTSQGSYDIAITFDIPGYGTFTDNFSESELFGNGAWIITNNGTKLGTSPDMDMPVEFTIVELTANKLHLQSKLEEIEPDFTQVGTANWVFTK